MVFMEQLMSSSVCRIRVLLDCRRKDAIFRVDSCSAAPVRRLWSPLLVFIVESRDLGLTIDVNYTPLSLTKLLTGVKVTRLTS